MSVFLFHRDFRTIDNSALIKLAEVSATIYPIFIFTPEQVEKKNPYYNERIIEFMIECVSAIPHIQFFYGDTIDVLESLFTENRIDYLGFNLDYTPYAKERSKRVLKLCQQYKVQAITSEDYTVVNMSEFREKGFYKVFKPFYEHLLKLNVPKPNKKEIEFSAKSLKSKFKIKKKIGKFDHRGEALAIMRKKFENYSETRSIPAIDTTHLSKYIKFGVVSIREVYHAYLKNTDLLRQIIWHDFYASLMNYLPEEDTIGGGNYQHKKVNWKKSESKFQRWCEGKTGVPLVDAGMRQMNETGWMHNRVRLITSNYLTMVLGIDWKKGEKYFAQKLIDYDVASNNLNWQFSAQVGTDRNPYVRIYNPYIQSFKLDRDCKYIKKWVPELRDVDPKQIHKWNEKYDEKIYYKPI